MKLCLTRIQMSTEMLIKSQFLHLDLTKNLGIQLKKAVHVYKYINIKTLQMLFCKSVAKIFF